MIKEEINKRPKNTIEKKINETKSWFFEKINTIDMLLARLIKKKKARTRIKKIRGEVTLNTTEYKYHKIILWIAVSQQTGQLQRNGQISRNIQPSKAKSERNKQSEKTDH